jgi:hypothetical protein
VEPFAGFSSPPDPLSDQTFQAAFDASNLSELPADTPHDFVANATRFRISAGSIHRRGGDLNSLQTREREKPMFIGVFGHPEARVHSRFPKPGVAGSNLAEGANVRFPLLVIEDSPPLGLLDNAGFLD